MSLNSVEDLLFNYLGSHPEEGRHWKDKVLSAARTAGSREAAATLLEGQLWRYFQERSAAASPFRELAERQGVRRTSLRNLAEHLLRQWAPLPEKRRPASGGIPGP